MNKNKKRNNVISMFLVAALVLGGAFAFLTAQDSVTNTFAVGKIDVELWEDFDGTEYGPDDGDPPALDLTVPTQIVQKAPYIKNTGDNEAYIMMEVAIPVEEVIAQDENGNFINNGEPAET